MTDSDRSMNEVPGLIEERRRYEGWLAALDARRESTPAHVFERVRADYVGRLDRVGEQLASHRQAIEEARSSVQARLSLLEAEERLRRDERAELDLRAHVGELVDHEAENAFRTVDESIAQLVQEREGLEGRIRELRALLDEGAPRLIEVSASPEATAPDSATAARAIEPELLATAAPESTAVAAAEAPTKPKTPATGAPPAGAAPVSPAHEPARPRTPTDSFDELAFLSSVVGAEDDEPIIERRDSAPLLSSPAGGDDSNSDSLLAGVENAKHATGERPLAANIAANTPIVLRPAGTIEQSKTLKCNECGAFNYPTEWYCERCGAELAAL